MFDRGGMAFSEAGFKMRGFKLHYYRPKGPLCFPMSSVVK